MESFDEFFKENFEDGLSDPSKYILSFTFKAGAQSRQAKIDELVDTIKTSAESEMYLFDELQKAKGERDELRKRIDEAIYDLQHIESAMWEEQVEHVLMILKGDQS